jgi:hypothetical protein
MTDLGDAPERSNDEIRRLLRQVLVEPQSAPRTSAPATAAIRAPSISDGNAPELSLDQILQKIQRDIAEGRPIPLGPSSA